MWGEWLACGGLLRGGVEEYNWGVGVVFDEHTGRVVKIGLIQAICCHCAGAIFVPI